MEISKGFSLLSIGGKLVYLYTKKPGKVPRCGDCKTKLQGVSLCFAMLKMFKENKAVCYNKVSVRK